MPASDAFAGNSEGLTSPLNNAEAITPHATNELTTVTRALYVGVAGDVAVVMADGTAVTFVGMLAGVVYPLRVKAVRVTGTTATDLIGLS